MGIRLRSFALAAVVASPFGNASAQRAEKTSDFKWSDQISSGHWVRVRDVNGKVTVGPASGDRVEVTAVKRWTRGNPDDVRIEAKKDGDDVVVCALWGRQTSCDDQGRRDRRWGNFNDDDDIQVEFTVLIPKGVKVAAASVNGGVVVTGATADVDLSTVNGNIRVETGAGPLNATTVNGTLHVNITGERTDAPMSFTTVNGSVIAELTPGFGADVVMTTVNGTLVSDYDMTVKGRIDPHHLSVHVGASGGPRITLTTVNGNVEMRKR